MQRGLGLLEVVVLQGQRGQGRMDLGRMRIDLQGGLKLAGGVGLVVLLQEEHPGLVMRRPVGGIELQRVRIQLVDQEIELVGEAVPAGDWAAARPIQRSDSARFTS